VTLRSDHVAGGFFVVFGLIVFLLSRDLPVGSLSMPGAGMMPKLVTGLMILFGLALIVRAGESQPFAAIGWDDIFHAGPVAIIAAMAVAAYEWLGFVVTMALMIFGLLVAIERRSVVRSALFAVGVTASTWALFTMVLKTPLGNGVLGFPP
jgi:hypothetical protein